MKSALESASSAPALSTEPLFSTTSVSVADSSAGASPATTSASASAGLLVALAIVAFTVIQKPPTVRIPTMTINFR